MHKSGAHSWGRTWAPARSSHWVTPVQAGSREAVAAHSSEASVQAHSREAHSWELPSVQARRPEQVCSWGSTLALERKWEAHRQEQLSVSAGSLERARSWGRLLVWARSLMADSQD